MSSSSAGQNDPGPEAPLPSPGGGSMAAMAFANGATVATTATATPPPPPTIDAPVQPEIKKEASDAPAIATAQADIASAPLRDHSDPTRMGSPRPNTGDTRETEPQLPDSSAANKGAAQPQPETQNSLPLPAATPTLDATSTPWHRPNTPQNQVDVSMADSAAPLPASTSQLSTRNTTDAHNMAESERENDPRTTLDMDVIDVGSEPAPWDQSPPPPSTPLNMMTHNFDIRQAARLLGYMNPVAPLSSPQVQQTVTPSQVLLPDYDDTIGPVEKFKPDVNTDTHIQSFARIEFQDCVFQMTTYEVVIGRDQRALRQARFDEDLAANQKAMIEEYARQGLPPPRPPISESRRKFSKSYVSEEGGMLGPESSEDDNDEDWAMRRPSKRRKTSAGGSSQKDKDDSQENMISDRQYISHTPGAAAVDLSTLTPSPFARAFIGIHSPGPNIAGKTKAISREHMKIRYNPKAGLFEANPIHSNGFFLEDVHIKGGEEAKNLWIVLRSGDRLQIKDVDFTFIIPGMEKGRTGAEERNDKDAETNIATTAGKRSRGGKEMSFDFEQSHDNGHMQDTSDSDNDLSPPPLSDEEDIPDDDGLDEDEMDVDENDDEDDAEADRTAMDGAAQELLTAEGDPLAPQVPKKRGPGRPPKNGIMSKREQRLLKKQQQELAKKTLPQVPPSEPPIKRKVGRPRKHPLPDNASEPPEKRKYKPRKPKNEDGEEVSDAERKAKEKKDKKVRPKSPPLDLRREEYTMEQLAKPSKNYSVLIDEALEDNPDGLTLKQIYKRICERYPHFFFIVETKGWESSVRHNLIGNKAFLKDEERGVWLRVPGVDLDSAKKSRKGTSPDRDLTGQGYGPYGYPYAGQQMAPGAPGYPASQVHPNFQMPPFNGQQQPRPPVQPYGQAHPTPTSQPSQPAGTQPPAPAHVPGYGLPPAAPARPQGGTAQPGTYSSPYASRPPPSAGPVVKPGQGGAGGTSTATPQPSGIATKPAYAPPAGVHSVANTSGVTQRQPQQPQQPQQLQQPQQPQQQPQQPQHQQTLFQQGTVQQTGQASAASASPAPNSKPPIDPLLLSAVVNLKNGLIVNLKKAHNPHAEAIVYSALNRCAGLKKEGTEQNDNMEQICMRGIFKLIDGFVSRSNRSPTPGTTPGLECALLEPNVARTILGFKDVSVKTLSGNLGASVAEAVTLSAIDRVLGFADGSLVREDRLASLEESLMNTARQLILNLDQRRAQGAEAAK